LVQTILVRSKLLGSDLRSRRHGIYNPYVACFNNLARDTKVHDDPARRTKC
ncbi:hypothetical protein T07_9815, partial [Trichinella nelsoni]